MSTESWKLEKDLCRCCHSEGSFKSINERYLSLDIQEMMNKNNVTLVVYSDMLRECFDIELASVTEPLNDTLCTICDACIQRLREATDFKHQVNDCERRFREQYLRQVGKDYAFGVGVKQEVVDPEVCNKVKVNVCCHDERTKDHDQRMVNDADVNMSDHGDLQDLKVEDAEENILLEGRKKVKLKKKDIAISSETKKEMFGLMKTATAVPLKNNEIVDTNEDINKVKQRSIKLKEDIDYKRVGVVFQCCKCKYVNKDANRIKYHIKRSHLKTPQYSCTLCSKTFLTWLPFINHKLQEHNIDDRFKCNACDSIFNQKAQLQKHISSFHMLGEKYKCDVCDYESFLLEYIKKHKTTHDNVKGFICELCRKSFKRKRALRLHERIHKGDKRKVCAVCGQAFVQKASLNYHMTKHHPEVNF